MGVIQLRKDCVNLVALSDRLDLGKGVVAWSIEQVLEIASTILDDFPAKIYLFGSWARGDAKTTSDIDLAIYSDYKLPEFALSRIRTEIEESHIPYRVDLIDLSEVSSDFKARVLREGILLTE